VRQRRTGVGTNKDRKESRTPSQRLFPRHFSLVPSGPINVAAGESNIPQEKLALAATPDKPVEDGRRNLLCTMQKQDCLFFVQMTISF
jgi:hypothetical protein